ncbi:MAG: ABC transporter substrate-binding protein [Kosmotoga sp.]|nr:MAG: ABC transporter substrate-binding protein [Kosmotoga sp.]
MKGKVIFLIGIILLASTFMMAKTQIVHWMHHSPSRAMIIMEMASQFMEDHPDVEIKIQTIPYSEYKTKLLAALAAGSGPDVAQIPAMAMKEFYNYGLIQPITESIASVDEMREKCIGAAIDNLIINDELYGFPTDVQTIVLFYNPDLFEKAGLDKNDPPQNWNELLEYAKKLTIWEGNKMVQSGLGIGGYSPVIETFMRQAGATFWASNEKSKIVYEKAQLEGLTFLTDAVLEHKVYVPEFGSRWTGFRQMKEAMVFGHGAMVGSFQVGGHPDLEFRTALPPAHPETGKRTTVLTSWALVLMSDCTNPKIASEWLSYISSPEAQKRWFKETGELPSYKSVINDPEFADDPVLSPILDSLNYAVPTFSVGWGNPASLFRETAYNNIINKGADPEEALKKAIEEINQYLEETFGIF